MRKIIFLALAIFILFFGCNSVSTKSISTADATLENITKIEGATKAWLIPTIRDWLGANFKSENNGLEYVSQSTGVMQGQFGYDTDEFVDMGVHGSYTIQKVRGSFTVEPSAGTLLFRMTVNEIYIITSEGSSKWRELSTSDFKAIGFNSYFKKHIKNLEQYLQSLEVK